MTQRERLLRCVHELLASMPLDASRDMTIFKRYGDAMAFETLPIEVRSDIVEALRAAWRQLAEPGTWWSGSERVAIAAAARGMDTSLSAPIAAAARKVYVDVTSIRRRWVEDLTAGDLDMPRYVELIGIVSRLAAADEFANAIGGPLEPLPVPVDGEPSRTEPPKARSGKTWVPMSGPRSITRALSLVPAESEAQRAIHGPLYMTYEDMADPAFRRHLDRAQMELIASRVSAVNECFY